MTVRFRAAAGTHLGTVRMNNEDSAVVSDQLLILADGMGGHAAGEIASVLAVRVFSEVDHGPGADLDTALLEAGRRARRALVAMSDADPVLESLGTTLITVVTDGSRVLIGHIGDSRMYVLRDGSMYQITTDHTHVQRLVEQGQLSPDKARTHPYRAMLLKSLDDHCPGPDLDLIEVSLEPGDRLLLCSDGLSDYLSAEQIGRALATEARSEAVEALIDAALRASTRDNVTVVVADVDSGAAPGRTDDRADEDANAGVVAVPLTEPGHFGAVVDGIRLSQEAADALAAALPGFELDPHEPWRGSALLRESAPVGTARGTDSSAVGSADSTGAAGTPDDDAPDPAGSAPAAVDVTGDGVSSAEQPGIAASNSAAGRGSSETANAVGTTSGDTAPREAHSPQDAAPTKPSVLPGVLSGIFSLAVLVLLAYFLFG
ncbi:PP2C family protein-serine/threonine phosphatase [Pseudactinotalea sp. Z1748]|uniref:PP2C family protein-serine/threonine phosphatase n=1 Tax=Pseudactinotalea sp. Z1748 TaxID=3413027 RepID=UPI003C7EABFC